MRLISFKLILINLSRLASSTATSLGFCWGVSLASLTTGKRLSSTAFLALIVELGGVTFCGVGVVSQAEELPGECVVVELSAGRLALVLRLEKYVSSGAGCASRAE